MAPPQRRSHVPWPVLNRLAQINVAISLCIAGMLRLSMEFSTPSNERPDPLVLLGFFALMAAAIWLIVRLRRELRALTRQWQRVVAAGLSFGLQFAVLELLLLTVVE